MNLFVLTSLFLGFLQIGQCGDDLFRVPITRAKSMLEGLLEQNTHPQHLDKIFGYRKVRPNEESNDVNSVYATPKPPSPRKNDTVKLYKYLQSQFCGDVLLGSPGQRFKMVFDTSTSHSWVPSVLCSPFAYPACYVKSKYDSAKSSTYVGTGQNKTMITDKGKLFGFISLDKLHVGQVSVQNQSFVEVEEMSINYVTNYGCDGILGMGFDDDLTDPLTPFFYNLISQKLIEKPVFSLYINRDPAVSSGGSLFLGGSDPRHYFGSFTYLSVSTGFSWVFKIDKIEVNYKLPYANRTVQVCSSGCQAFPETGDLLIRGPRDDIKVINRFLSANFVPYLNRYEIPCNKINVLPHVTFYLGGKNFTISGRDYVQQLTRGPFQLCLSAFAELPGPPQKGSLWGLGGAFLGQHYTEYDMENRKIGVAKAKTAW